MASYQSISYQSTRGEAPIVGFSQVLLGSTSPDGGLYVPNSWPQFGSLDLSDLSYSQLVARTVGAFAGEDFSIQELEGLAEAAYSSFEIPDAVQLEFVADLNLYLLDLTKGPTLTFKDVALQMMGQMFDYELGRQSSYATVLTATSGDTGAAVIEACAGRQNIQTFVLHPKDRISEIQRKMMTTNESPNIMNLSIEGDFDDCQNIVKELFADSQLEPLNLAAMNSINWARISAQVAYYLRAISQLEAPPVFSVPSGNFGNVYSGWVATQMGFAIKALIAATNSNDALTGFINKAELGYRPAKLSLAPAMDVSVPSNLERLIFELLQKNGPEVERALIQLKNRRQKLDILPPSSEGLWHSYSVSDKRIQQRIKKVRQTCGIWVDPHTAVGIDALLEARKKTPELNDFPQVVLATANPAKFEALYEKAEDPPQLPARFADLKSRPERLAHLPNNYEAVKNYITQHSENSFR